MSYSSETRSGFLTYLKDLDDQKVEWGICVQAVRVYEVPSRDGTGNKMEIIFHDKPGTRIHAQVKRPELEKFRASIKEGSVCALQNFTVHANYHTFKTTNHPYILGIYKDTLWFDLGDYPFLCYMYNMCPFEKLPEPMEQSMLTCLQVCKEFNEGYEKAKMVMDMGSTSKSKKKPRIRKD